MSKRNRTDYREKTKKLQTEVGYYGLPISNGKVVENAIRKLRGTQKIKVLEEMVDFDPTIGAFNNLYRSTAASVDWYLKPKDDSGEANKIKDFINSCLFEDLNHPFEDLISNALTASQYGFALAEPVYKIRNGQQNDEEKSSIFNDGLIGLSKVASRYQGSITKWNYDENYRKIESVTQKNPNNYSEIEIPYNKLLHFRFRGFNNNPEGKSLFHNCVEAYLNKKNFTVLEAIRYEKGYSGLLVAKTPSVVLDPNTRNPQYLQIQAWLKDTLQNLRDGLSTGVALPEFITLETIGDTQGTPNANEVITREDRNISVALLSDFFLASQKSGISGGFTQSKIKIFTNLVKEMLSEIRQVINFKLIPTLLEKNLMDVELAPTIEFSEIGDLDLTSLMLFIQSADKSGLVPPTLDMCKAILKRLLGNDAPDVTQEEFDNYQLRREVNTWAYGSPQLAEEVANKAQEPDDSEPIEDTVDETTANN